MVLLWKNKMIYKNKQLSNTWEMFVARLTRRFVAAKRLFADLQSEFIGKLVKHHAQSRPKSRSQILDVDSLALYRRRIPNRTFTN